MTYTSAIQYLYDRLPVFHHVGAAAYKPGLDNTIRLLENLGNPHQNFKSIHIAGTNGKGSVSHILSAVFQSAGYKTGLYTSPHLVNFGERIRVNGEMIDEEFVVNFVENNTGLFETIQPSFFEATMAMAFSYFAYRKVDIAIIEVGLGGRLDSTNIIQPLLSVITNISFDHIGFLGDTLAKIAFEKAGIIKPNTPVVVGEWVPETLEVFRLKALETGSLLSLADSELQFIANDENKMICKTQHDDYFRVGLIGNYQLKNVSTVLKTIDVFRKFYSSDFKINNKALKDGIENVIELTGLRGRWEKLQESPTIIADTGHNVGGISYVTEQLLQQQYNQLHIVFGMVNDKDINHVLEILPRNAQYYFTQAAVVRALPSEELQKIAQSHDLNGSSYPSVKEAVKQAVYNATQEDFIYIGGSNFVVGEALEFYDTIKKSSVFMVKI